MFTGIVEEQGTVASLQKTDGGARLVVRANATLEGTRIDDSICVSGVCLTVVACDADSMSFDAIPETLARSTLGSLAPGQRVNLERALSGSQRFGGHYVQGHVDTRANVVERIEDGNAVNLRFRFSNEHKYLVTEKGFIAIDGVSLTVTDVTADTFAVSIIPHTRARVTLGTVKPGDDVNLEFDVFAKYVQRAVDDRIAKLESDVGELRRRIAQKDA